MTVIDRFDGEYDWLSNFGDYGFVDVNGMWWDTVEHYYQAKKSLDPKEQERVQKASNPGEAKKLGRRVTIRSDWEQGVKLTVMAEALYWKFTQNLGLKVKLLSTGDAELIEGNWWGDRYWGVCYGTGENHLGRLLMALREKLKGQT